MHSCAKPEEDKMLTRNDFYSTLDVAVAYVECESQLDLIREFARTRRFIDTGRVDIPLDIRTTDEFCAVWCLRAHRGLRQLAKQYPEQIRVADMAQLELNTAITAMRIVLENET